MCAAVFKLFTSTRGHSPLPLKTMGAKGKGKGKEGGSAKGKKVVHEEEPRRSKRKADLPEDNDEDEETSSDEEEESASEDSDNGSEEGDVNNSNSKNKKTGSAGSGEVSKGKRFSTPVGSMRKEQGTARGFNVTPGDDCGSPALTDDADGRFEKESPRTEGGIRTAAKYLVLATLHSNGRGATPYPTEKQYLGMICDYENVPRWWNAKGIGQPVTAAQKKLMKNWAWIKGCLSTTFTNNRARLKKETTRMFFLLYKIKQIEVYVCFTASSWGSSL